MFLNRVCFLYCKLNLLKWLTRTLLIKLRKKMWVWWLFMLVTHMLNLESVLKGFHSSRLLSQKGDEERTLQHEEEQNREWHGQLRMSSHHRDIISDRTRWSIGKRILASRLYLEITRHGDPGTPDRSKFCADAGYNRYNRFSLKKRLLIPRNDAKLLSLPPTKFFFF